MWKAMKSVFLGILLNESYCLKAKLMETKFYYRVKLKMSHREIFSQLF